MTNAYCYLSDVRSRLAGDAPNLGPTYDQVIADKILEVSADIDRQVSQARGVLGGWSFVADAQYAVQIVTISALTAPTSGTFALSFAGQTTTALAFNATAATVQAALVALSTIGAGDATVAGAAGGPYTVSFAGTQTGPQPRLSGLSSLVGPSSPITMTVQEIVQAVPVVPSERLFVAKAGGVALLPIDDCISISAVKLYSAPGVLQRTLVVNTDYLPWPMQGAPIHAIRRFGATWDSLPALVGVTAPWGYASAMLPDVREATAIEVIRSHLGDKAGNSDMVGVTPFGQVMYSKAFTSKVKQLVSDYSQGAGFLR